MLNRRKTDEGDSTTSVWFNYILAILVSGGVFASDWYFDMGILDGALIGILISKVYDGLTKQNEYFFPNARSSKSIDKRGETDETS